MRHTLLFTHNIQAQIGKATMADQLYKVKVGHGKQSVSVNNYVYIA
jgi:hypothetical protein